MTISFLLCAGEYHVIDKYVVFKDLGKYTTHDFKCTFEVGIFDMGGYFYTVVGKKKVDDITAFAYLEKGKMLFSTSPIYGTPGISVVDCKSGKSSLIIKAKNKIYGYSNGADYFELESVNGSTIFFYYFPDIDKVDDLEHERTPKNLFQTDHAGKTFKKASAVKK